MASLSLGEAAEKTGTAKVDIWRAIKDGTLSAKKTGDGGFAIDESDLFRLFKPQQPEQPRPLEEPRPEILAHDAAPPEDAAAGEDIAVAFAALAAELKGLLVAQGAGESAKD